MNSHSLLNICVFFKLYCLLHVLCFIVFSMFFMLSERPLCSIVLLPCLAILTNLILFFIYPTHSELLFTVKPFYNLSLPLSTQPFSVVLCAWWNIHALDSGTPLWSVGKRIAVYPQRFLCFMYLNFIANCPTF